MRNILVIVALVALAGCSGGRYTGNAYNDYRMTSFSGVNHCLHNTILRCH